MVPGEALRGLAGVALFAAPGSGLTELLPALRQLPPGRRLAYAYLLGVAWTAGWLYALSHWLAIPLRSLAILSVAAIPTLAGAAFGWRRRHRERRAALPLRPPATAPPAARLALIVGAAVTAAVFCEALTAPLLDWDGRQTWSTQARYVRAEGSVDASVLTAGKWWVTCPWYPLLMPVAQVAVLEVTRAEVDHHAFRPMYSAFLPVWLLLLWGGASRYAGQEAAGWTTLAAAMLSFPAFAHAGGASSAYSDLPLACFVGGGALLLLGNRGRPSAGLAAGILLAAGVLTKAEGEILGPFALFVAAVVPLLSTPSAARRGETWRRRRTMLALASLPVVFALALLHSWRAGIAGRFESFTRLTSWSLLWPGILTRLPRLVHDVGAEMLSYKNWGVFWCVAPFVVAAGWRGARRRPARALLLLAGAPLGIGWLYATIAVDPYYIVFTTWDRFLLQASLPLLVVFAMALRDLARHLKRTPRSKREGASPSALGNRSGRAGEGRGRARSPAGRASGRGRARRWDRS
ncbi:MAG TPA: hypothetical protein VHR45_14240 [Thermoanaerobaculia bacterium]|nr:hypothetical protein [Thermoanaerobaculia bacterium]